MANLYNHFPEKDMVMPYIALEPDIVREYNSVDNFKHFLSARYVNQIRILAENMLDTMERVPASVIILSRRPGLEHLCITHIMIDPFMRSQDTKRTLPVYLRSFIAGDFAKKAEKGEQIYGMLFYSEAHFSWAKMPKDTTEYNLEHSPSDDPKRVEAVVVLADFIFGGAMLVYEITRPEGSPPLLKNIKGLSTFTFDDKTGGVGGIMAGLLRKTAGIYKPPPMSVKINPPKEF